MNEPRSPGFVAKWKRWRKGSPELLRDLQCEALPHMHPDRRAKYGWEDRPKAPISAQDRKRLRSIYGALCVFTIDSTEHGSTVAFSIPLIPPSAADSISTKEG